MFGLEKLFGGEEDSANDDSTEKPSAEGMDVEERDFDEKTTIEGGVEGEKYPEMENKDEKTGL